MGSVGRSGDRQQPASICRQKDQQQAPCGTNQQAAEIVVANSAPGPAVAAYPPRSARIAIAIGFMGGQATPAAAVCCSVELCSVHDHSGRMSTECVTTDMHRAVTAVVRHGDTASDGRATGDATLQPDATWAHVSCSRPQHAMCCDRRAAQRVVEHSKFVATTYHRNHDRNCSASTRCAAIKFDPPSRTVPLGGGGGFCAEKKSCSFSMKGSRPCSAVVRPPALRFMVLDKTRRVAFVSIVQCQQAAASEIAS